MEDMRTCCQRFSAPRVSFPVCANLPAALIAWWRECAKRKPTATRPVLLSETYRLLIAGAVTTKRSCRLIAFQIVTWP